jgi:hypothetical protein
MADMRLRAQGEYPAVGRVSVPLMTWVLGPRAEGVLPWADFGMGCLGGCTPGAFDSLRNYQATLPRLVRPMRCRGAIPIMRQLNSWFSRQWTNEDDCRFA